MTTATGESKQYLPTVQCGRAITELILTEALDEAGLCQENTVRMREMLQGKN